MTTIQLIFGAAFAVATVAIIVLTPRHRAGAWAVVLAVTWSTLVPLRAAPDMAILASVSVSILALLIAVLRAEGPVVLRAIGVVGCALFVYMRGVEILTQSSVRTTGLFIAITIMVGLVILVANRFTREDVGFLTKGLIVLLVVHGAYACVEIIRAIPAVWPSADGINDITVRVHRIFPGLPGRPMTSFSHPIPLGTFAMFVSVFAMYAVVVLRKRIYLVWFAAAFGLILLSGTRSAVLTALVAVCFIFLFGARIGKLWRFMFGIGIAGLTAMSIDFERIATLIGLGDQFVTSSSYLHRTSVIESSVNLLSTPTGQMLFGVGTRKAELFESGTIRGYIPGATFFDNQFVAMAAMYGVIGLVIFLIVMVVVLARGGVLTRALMASIIAMSFSFDFMDWLNTIVFFALTVGLASAGKEIEPTPGSLHIKSRDTAVKPRFSWSTA